MMVTAGHLTYRTVLRLVKHGTPSIFHLILLHPRIGISST